jgi:hypothetical protein
MKNSEDTALELFNFYRESLESCCDDCSKELAKTFAQDHCDRMIAFIDTQMQGWLDTDMIVFWKSVKQNVTKY